MAVGKTTAARYIEENTGIFVSYEDPSKVIKKIRDKGLDKNIFEDFIETQRMFISAEIERWKSYERYEHVVTDFGVEEIEFHTLFYPVVMGYDWDVEEALKDELRELRKCRIDMIIYMDSDLNQLIKNKENDSTRKRGSFEFYADNFLKYKKEWILKKKNVKVIQCTGLNKELQNTEILSIVKDSCKSSQENQPKHIYIDETLRLRKFDHNYDFALEWYQDHELLRLVDGEEAKPYDWHKLKRMYNYLDKHGELYFIEVMKDEEFVPVGDVTFWQNDMPIVIGDKGYRGKGIGYKVITTLVKRARELGYKEIYVNEIYSYNIASQRTFEKAGFKRDKKTEKGFSYIFELYGHDAKIIL